MKTLRECRTAEELKKEYFKLAKLYHPDMGGTTAQMQELTALYQSLWARLKDIHTDKDGNQYTAKNETVETSEQYPEIITKIIHLQDIIIEICGSWIWLSGNTRAYKEIFKELGFKWSKNKLMWYWRAEENRCFWNRKSRDIEYIRETYGSERVSNLKPNLLAV